MKKRKGSANEVKTKRGRETLGKTLPPREIHKRESRGMGKKNTEMQKI